MDMFLLSFPVYKSQNRCFSKHVVKPAGSTVSRKTRQASPFESNEKTVHHTPVFSRKKTLSTI
jgi:hypothetical protein